MVGVPAPRKAQAQENTKRIKDTETFMSRMRFKRVIPVSERAKSVHASDSTATVTFGVKRLLVLIERRLQ